MIAVTVSFINKRGNYQFWKGFSKNLLLPIVASPSCKLSLVILQLKPSRATGFGRSDASKYLLNPICLNKLSPKSRAWSRSIVCQHETFPNIQLTRHCMHIEFLLFHQTLNATKTSLNTFLNSIWLHFVMAVYCLGKNWQIWQVGLAILTWIIGKINV